MDNCVVIKSSVEFVLVGPFDSMEGIYIKSDSVDIDTIGYANLIYQKGYSSKNKGIGKTPLGYYVWSRNYTLFDRNVRFLFFGKVKEQGMFGLNIDYNTLEDELNRFIENSFSQLKNIATDRLNTEGLRHTDESKILWDISPLILQFVDVS